MLHAKNLTVQTVEPCRPWEFVCTEKISAQVRGDKDSRQEWYQTPATNHSFYTGIEGANNTQRASKDNPPHKIHAFVADYDVAIPQERVNEAVHAMPIKPTWTERSLGGNVRLVWVLESPMLVDDYQLCAFVLTEAVKWLNLDMLPGLDEKAFTSPTRLYCNGCDWTPTGAAPVRPTQTQAFFVSCGRSFRFKASDGDNIPLSEVEPALRAAYPTMVWPGEFSLEAQGPSFWLPESTSPQSAILKAGGFFTFSAHAKKSFYTWTDLLGADFTKKYSEDSLAKATENIWWDGKRFWRLQSGIYQSLDKVELGLHFKVACKVSAKPNSDGVSPSEVAMNHIFNEQRVKAAVPFVMREQGPHTFLGARYLNTYAGKPIAPATGAQTWGPTGNFPFISLILDNLFTPASQLPHYLAWLKHYYTGAFERDPMPGQNTFIMGGVNLGKTLINRQLVGVGVGGYSDASDYLVDGGQFNSHLLHVPHWAMDDDTPTNNPSAQARMQAMLKKSAANQQFLCNTKFEQSGMCEWQGRIGVTTNLDFVSMRVVGPLDNSALDKTNLFRGTAEGTITFPNRTETKKLMEAERPAFYRWLLDWTVPDSVERCPRFGYHSYQEAVLLDHTHQAGSSASFKEILMESLADYFKDNPSQTVWEGPVTKLMTLIMRNAMNEYAMRHLKMENMSRYLEQIHREGVFKAEASTGPMKTRIWKFTKPDNDN